jgi:hypothetical protein
MRRSKTARRKPAFVPALAAAAALALSLVQGGTARAETPIPPMPEGGVAAAGVPDALDPLRAFLRGFRSESGAVRASGGSHGDDSTSGSVMW